MAIKYRFLTAAATALVVVLSTATPCSAQNYELHVDCDGYGDIENTCTSNRITIEFLGGPSESTTARAGNRSDSDCAPPSDWLDIFTKGGGESYYGVASRVSIEYRVRSVRISTNGDNAFWIDQLDLQGPWRGHWGINKGQGYCLSTDPTDADRTWADFASSRGCHPCFEFRIAEDDVVNCQSGSQLFRTLMQSRNRKERP